MRRSRFRSVLLVGIAAVGLAGCSAASTSPPVAPSPSALAPGQVWLAVLDSAEDPNALDGPRADLVGAAGEGSATHVVVSPSACYGGLPSRYDGRYILGVWDGSEAAVRTLLTSADAQPEWIGPSTSTCVD